MPIRVVVMLVANIIGDCPNLLANNRCGIYEDRPLVCRIYPAEINPFIALERGNKLCPPEAWTQDLPLLQRGGNLRDDVMRRDIELSRAADALEVNLKSRLCLALNFMDTALVHEAILIYSPSAQTLLSALAFAIAADCAHEPPAQWRFVSELPETLATLTKNGAVAFHPRDAQPGSFQHLGFKREAIFSFDAERASWPPKSLGTH